MPGFVNRLPVRRCLTLITGLLECLIFAGTVFGWASLVFVLKTEDYFSFLCVNTTGVNATQDLDCSGQDEQFSLVFTIASFLFTFLTLPNGFLFDRFGTTVSRLFGIFFFTVGALMMAFLTAALSNLLFPALALLAAGGCFFQLTNLQVGNLFGSHRSTVITLYSGAVDSSAAVFFIIKLIYEAGISLLPSFLFLSACSVIHLLRTFFLMPRGHIPYPLPDDYTYGITCGETRTLSLEHITANRNMEMTPEIVEDVPVKQEKSFRECVLSRLFWLHVLWLSVMLLRHYFFIGTLNPMLQWLTEEEPSLVSRYINAFAITQLCGVLCAPWNGLLMDRNKGQPRAAGESEQEADLRTSVLPLFLTALQCVVFSVCATIPNLPLQYFTFVIEVINRSFLFGGNAAFISVAFPPCHFGKLFGLVMALSAAFSLLQYACFSLVNGPLDGDPLYVNIALTLLILFAFTHPLSVYLHCRSLSSKRATNASS
ncbi:equilibrative nucleobase transporter 1-like [Centropristis striata]|uniref:equilibrative nucleobase transporter 1-like n=1 Tax=Centropristis striata TaxID=184440 RepID=UPI0027DF1F0C|nr:equilibrative nucleobase transporter 1-like [Centropristis striata]XP_059202932.1 equilibrative nucleobase transporter 1-like [Centropristis striata]